MNYTESIGARTYRFADLKTLLAKASPLRSGDQLAGVAAGGERRGTRGRENGARRGAAQGVSLRSARAV